MKKYLIVGLGNRGWQFENTRHQIGYMIIDQFVKKNNLFMKEDASGNWVTNFVKDNKNIYLIKPITFMNLSGDNVKRFVDYYDIPLENILVIYDDVSIPFTKFKIKPNGSPAGHNGIKDVLNKLGTDDIKRLKVGILNNEVYNKIDLKEFVLTKFNNQELDIIKTMNETLFNVINDFPIIDIDSLMSKYNNN